MRKVIMMAAAVCVMGAQAQQADDEAELAKKTQNPVASMVSVPLQYNIDFGIGPADATRQTLNIQPVMPTERATITKH